MKKLLSLFLALLMLFSLAACGMSREEAELIAGVAEALLEDVGSEPETAPPKEALPVSSPEKAEGRDILELEELPDAPSEEPSSETPPEELPDPDGSYTTKEDVALYLHVYGCLPGNFMTKKEAQALGWPGGDLRPYAEDMCIGGDRFGNYEGLLPKAPGRQYYECDIDTLGAGSRGAKRIIYSGDGLIYYTGDHYKSFELLYGEE